MKLAEFLRVPYLLRSQSVPAPDGGWLRRVEYPELPGCVAERPTLIGALDELDRRRVLVIVGLLRAGERPALPRPPVPVLAVAGELARLGLAELTPLINLDERELAER
jgi:predicted RNase H-like HicB family nuclease